MIHKLFTIGTGLCLFITASAVALESTLATLDGSGRIVYGLYANQNETNAVNKLIDFSYCGYRGGGVALPNMSTIITLDPVAGDDKTSIQNAINTVSARTPDSNGFRGAVLLRAGRYQVSAGLNINTSGVVLRGEGQGTTGTVLEATTPSDYNVITIKGGTDSYTVQDGTLRRITTAYVPSGATSFNVSSTTGYAVGQMIILQRTVNQFWLDDLAMTQWGWNIDSYSHKYERWITSISGNTITIQPAVVDPIQDKYGGGQIFIPKRTIPRIRECGIENLRIESCYASDTDENHPWEAIRIECIENGWVRGVTAQYFAGSAVSLSGYARNITVQDCAFLNPKSLIDGGRRYPFYMEGSATCNLIQRCYANQSRHDFVTGAYTTGPNAFVDCYGEQSLLDTGPHHRWATGILFDNIYSSYMLAVENRAYEGTGHGWSGAQTVYWNSKSNKQRCDAPKGGMNFAIGTKAIKDEGRVPEEPYGWWEHQNQDVTPRSLYYQQLKDRLGTAAVENTTMYLQRMGSIWTQLQQWKGEGTLNLDLNQLSGTYVDATLSNTDMVDPHANDSVWLDGDQTQTSNLWMNRTGIGVNGALFQSNRSGGIGNSPLLKTTISGLSPNAGYDVFIAYGSLGGGAGDYACVYAGLNRNFMIYFDAQMLPAKNILGVTIHEGYVGAGAADAGGNLVVYIDDYPNPADGNHRTWYDGLVYRPTTPPAVTGPDDVILMSTGQNVQFQVSADSVSPITNYKWYKSTNAVADAADTLITGAVTNTLTISSVQLADENYYYCVVSNIGGPSTSRAAKLGIKRKVAHWSLNELVGGQYADSNGENHHASPAGSPAFVGGPSAAANNAVVIDTDNGWANAGTWNPSHVTGELTMAGWVKWNGSNSSPQVILSKITNWSPASDMMWQFGVNSLGRLSIKRNGAAGITFTDSLKTNEWVFVAASFDGTDVALYMSDNNRNTFVTASTSFSLGGGINSAFWIGCSADASVAKDKFNGALDEIQVFNYAKDVKGIADLYNEVLTKSFCFNPDALIYDLDHNCVVDLADFMIFAQNWLSNQFDINSFASSWLSCNAYPVSTCP